MTFAASRCFLRVTRVRDTSSVRHATQNTYHATRKEAVAALIEREEAAIQRLEKQAKRARANLRAFMRKEGITAPVAQTVEQRTRNAPVARSIRAGSTNHKEATWKRRASR